MPSSSKKKSSAASDREERNSIYDFLYHDPRRVGSFLAQFDPRGHLQSLNHSLSSEDASENKATLGGGASIPLIADLSGSGETSFSEATNTALSKTYDPLWANALAFLDYLIQNDLINREIDKASIGQFTLSSGSLAIVDTTFVQKLSQTAAIRRLFSKNNASRINPNTGKPFTKDEIDLDFEMLRILEPQIQMQLTTDDGAEIWGTFRSEGLVTPSSELNMKHGVIVEGRWSILGIKDADPIVDVNNMVEDIEDAKLGFAGRQFLVDAIDAHHKIMTVLGRPFGSFGLTPLIVFREIGEVYDVD